MGESATAGADDTAKPVLFLTGAGVRKGWETITMSAERPMLSVIDAANGKALFRQDLGSDARSGPAIKTPVTWNVPDPRRPDGRGQADQAQAQVRQGTRLHVLPEGQARWPTGAGQLHQAWMAEGQGEGIGW